MTGDGVLLGRHKIQHFRFHYKINVTFALEMCCGHSSWMSVSGDCNCLTCTSCEDHPCLSSSKQTGVIVVPSEWGLQLHGWFQLLCKSCKTLLESTSSEQRHHPSGWSIHLFSSQGPGHNQANTRLYCQIPRPKHLAALHKRYWQMGISFKNPYKSSEAPGKPACSA